MIISVIEPKSPVEFNKYFDLRWRILRQPWDQPRGSERDDEDETSFHRMVINKTTGEALAVGRLQFNTKEETQIRYMAVGEGFQGQGLGSKIMVSLEDIALEKGADCIILQARKNAVQFYQSNGYKILKKSYILFDEIQHWLMKKELTID